MDEVKGVYLFKGNSNSSISVYKFCESFHLVPGKNISLEEVAILYYQLCNIVCEVQWWIGEYTGVCLYFISCVCVCFICV